MEPSRILAVDHVNLEAPPGLDDELRWFYGEVAVLEERTEDPAECRLLCFKSERIELRIHLVDAPQIDPVAYRVTIAVPSLDEAAEHLVDRRRHFVRLSGLLFSDRRLDTLDPAGNRVMLKQYYASGSL